MTYIVIELQTNAAGQTANIVTAYDNQPQAENKFHSILAAAAVSAVPKHAAVILNEDGLIVKQWCYDHS
ncbi:Uncharacterised protein [Slackia heliotrinireducens]|uniref:Uncharacterized protein n=1 Tax=Slackia heliotrinireducens (strain ATCC 29202 / DSM 20476 / NCTC 11029 / RHS 1) TaxID=471855 RepID=C7N6M4_SLAHD|nr:hypothetical protein [Slackia heliotrinireducens]ACV22559.1 hypothetical protein Shel_15400 [Slackia heliotrinireducens DSM 20476]VEH01031.1 Uncharacterised protein [Slackia heliotrinireducens]